MLARDIHSRDLMHPDPRETREEKLEALEKIKRLDGGESVSALGLEWQDCPQDWQAPFVPTQTGKFFGWPMLPDLFPWHHSGCQFKRTWPIGETKELLEDRWRALLDAPAEKRAKLFKETRDRKITSAIKTEIHGGGEPPIKELDSDTPVPLIQPYSFRSFDNQFSIIDTRICDYLRPPLWHSLSDKQVFFTTLMSFAFAKGPAINATPYLPDICHFQGRCGKDVFPLYRDEDARKPNVTQGLLDFLGRKYTADITPEDLFAYVYAILGGQSYTRIFWDELENPGARIPITKDSKLFEKASESGKELIWLHTYAQRFRDKQQNRNGTIPKGRAEILTAITEYPGEFSYKPGSKELRVGSGRIGPIEPEVWDYEISGLKVLRSWLGYRMKKPRGRKSSKLDDIRPQYWSPDMTTTLISLVWILEATISMEPDLESILQAVVKSECFRVSEFPKPSESQKQSPKPSTEAIPSLDIDGEMQGG